MLIHQASEEKSGNLYEAIALPQVFQSGRIGESAHGRSPDNMFQPPLGHSKVVQSLLVYIEATIDLIFF